MISKPTDSLRQAAAFLGSLIGLSADEALVHPFTFQTFDEAQPEGNQRKRLTKVIHSNLSSVAQDLESLNGAGAGIFVAVNETNGKGRKKTDIRVLRGWWADLDLKNAIQEVDLDIIRNRLPLAPTIIVETPGGWHLYWLPRDPISCPNDAIQIEHEDELRAIQNALEPYGADPKVCDVARVMRVPGFLHQKKGPQPVELILADGPRWTRDEIRMAFPVLSRQARGEKQPGSAVLALRTAGAEDRHQVINRAAAYLASLPGGRQGSDGSGITFQAALKTITQFALDELEATTLMLEVHNPKCVPPWSLDDLEHKVADAWRVAQASQDLGCALTEPALPSNLAPEAEGMVIGDSDEAKSAPGVPMPQADEDRPVVPGFEWDASGLIQLVESNQRDRQDDLIPPTRSWLAPPFWLPGLVRGEDSTSWQLLIRWNDPDGLMHEEALPFELISGEGAELARRLSHGGMVLPPDPGPRKALLRYLSAARVHVHKRERLLESFGWQGGAFVLPDGQTIGQSDEPVRFAGEQLGLQRRATVGTLEGWQSGVARYAVGNPRLAFGLSCAFAGPIMGWVLPGGGGGFNLQGFSSKGKR